MHVHMTKAEVDAFRLALALRRQYRFTFDASLKTDSASFDCIHSRPVLVRKSTGDYVLRFLLILSDLFLKLLLSLPAFF